MSQMTNSIISIISTDTTLATDTATTFDQEIDFRNSINGFIQIDFQFSVAPTADKTLDLYLLPAISTATDYDIYSQGRNIELGSITVEAVTTLQRLSVSIDSISVPYGKIAMYNNDTGQIVTIKKLTIVTRKI